MIIREQHVRIEAELSQVNSDRRRSFEPEEIDIAINTVIGQFISTRAKQYAAGDQQSVEDIATLIVTGVTQRAYKVGENTYMVILPTDIKELSGVRFLGKRLCGTTAPAITSATLNIHRLRSPQTVHSTPFYAIYKLLRGATVLWDITVVKSGWTGITDADTWFTLKKQLELEAMRNGMGVNNFGFEGKQDYIYDTSAFSVVVDSVTTSSSSVSQAVTYYTGLTQNIYGEAVSPIKAIELQATPFYKATTDRILYHANRYQSLMVYTPSDVILDSAIISYIKKPAITDVILGINCDLPDNNRIHELICKMAVRHLMGDTGDERYPLKKAEELTDSNNNR